MSNDVLYQSLADAVLVLHVGFVAFVAVGLALVVIGNLQHWQWVNNLGFRLCHLAAIACVVAGTWLGIACPLTNLEMWLREHGGQTVYAGSFVEHWLHRVLYYDAPAWVFAVIYTAFGLLVVASWRYFPPRLRHRG